MKQNKCYAVPVVLYVMAENKRAAKESVRTAMKEATVLTIDLTYALGGDFEGIIGFTDKVLNKWDVNEFAKPEKVEKNFRNTWTPKEES